VTDKLLPQGIPPILVSPAAHWNIVLGEGDCDMLTLGLLMTHVVLFPHLDCSLSLPEQCGVHNYFCCEL
jgi:hypothetical protein